MTQPTASMVAAASVDKQSFELAQRPLPEPEAGEVRVRIQACGICGSDLHLYRLGLLRKGHTPGHEISGVIEEVGRGVKGCRVGDRVAVEPLLSCGTCPSCLAGRDATCRKAKIFGVHLPGGLAEYIVVPEFRVYTLASDLDPTVAALTEPVAVALHGLAQGRFEKGARVLVLGSGSVGLISVLAASWMGAREVWATARHAHQAELARTLGASRVLSESEARPTELAKLGLNHDIDLALETVGGEANTLEAACAAVRPGGHVSVLGLFHKGIHLPGLPLVFKEITISGSNCYTRRPGTDSDFRVAADLVNQERERLALLISDRIPLSDVDRAFKLAADKRRGVIKISVQPGS
ncbi:MAG: alcohol dehydrogenase catalytic domain-containing protein [Myxococcota bacterium]|nr:alcohol dehydrogenase catalytic domain-containing protein [Myxococcota bacterium]